MSNRPRLLDLFCGAGGCAVGYDRAGFDVVGIDHRPQPRYPFEFHQADALEYLAAHGAEFDAIHASPPCQAFSQITRTASRHARSHQDLIGPVRDLLVSTGRVWVIENVPEAPLRNAVQLCGSSFGLELRRHRLFESNVLLWGLPCNHGWQTPRFPPNRSDRKKKAAALDRVVSVSGHDTRGMASVVSAFGSPGGKGGVELWRRAMGIRWMTRDELAQAIPPAYAEFVGRQLLIAVRN